MRHQRHLNQLDATERQTTRPCDFVIVTISEVEAIFCQLAHKQQESRVRQTGLNCAGGSLLSNVLLLLAQETSWSKPSEVVTALASAIKVSLLLYLPGVSSPNECACWTPTSPELYLVSHKWLANSHTVALLVCTFLNYAL